MQWALLALCIFVAPLAQAENKAPEKSNATQVIEAFDRQQIQKVDQGVALSDQKKRQVMFFLGVPLIILLLITGALGIAMAVYGKPLFVVHMIFAGLTVTLAIAHVIVGVAWFFPF